MLYAEFPCVEYPSIMHETDNAFSVCCINSTLLGRSKCPWFCNSDIHRGYLTEILIKEHKCLEKNCTFLYKVVKVNEHNPYEQKKQKSILKKQGGSITCDIFEKACILTRNIEGIVIIRIESNGPFDWIVCYAAFGVFDFTQIIEQMENELKVNVTFYNLNYTFDRIAQLIINRDHR